MTKKRILAVLSLVLALMCILSSGAAYASDTPSSWAVDQVNSAIASNLVPQNLQSNYTKVITRAEFASLAVALYENIKGEITERTTFTDTNDVNVEKAAAIGVVSGVGNNKFDPNGTLTREQAAVMLSRLSDAIGQPFPAQAPTFADNSSISSWALDSVGRVQAAGIMSGIGDNKFSPQGPYTREQSIVTVGRTWEAIIPNLTPITPPTEVTEPTTQVKDSDFPPLPEGAEGWARAIRDTQIDGGKGGISTVKEGEILPYGCDVVFGETLYYFFKNNTTYSPENIADWEILK